VTSWFCATGAIAIANIFASVFEKLVTSDELGMTDVENRSVVGTSAETCLEKFEVDEAADPDVPDENLTLKADAAFAANPAPISMG
jgi:hypothetical protein